MDEQDLLWKVYTDRRTDRPSIGTLNGDSVHYEYFERYEASILKIICEQHNKTIVKALLNRRDV